MIERWLTARCVLVLAMGLGAGLPAWGQPATRPGTKPSTQTRPAVPEGLRMSPQERARRIRENMAQTLETFNAGRYAEAERLVREGWKLAPEDPTFPYNLACALAKQGKKPEALAALEQCIQMGWSDSQKIRIDEDLISLREDSRFKKALEDARVNYKKSLGEYEKGENVRGMKVHEGNPEDGLRWRLRLSDKATKEKPHRLIIWMHPSGGSMNATIERMAPDLATYGLGVLVLTQKSFAGWSEDDKDRLLSGTLPDVAKVEGVSIQKPILMGFSAGGQMALMMYQADPGKFGALIIDAAYPVKMTGGARFSTEDPPKGEAKKKVPLYVILGEGDPGAQIWQLARKPWTDAGVPLSLRMVPNGFHQWLFGKPQIEDLQKWLEDVQSGKLPSGEEKLEPSTKVVM